MKRDAAEGMNGDSAMVGGHGGSRRRGESITGKRYAWPDLGAVSYTHLTLPTNVNV